ncbi:MFS transporter [Streptomyces sp. NBC_01214]|uniref:MFS transporter n=1 Tax=Streptomyces sp. NBC_01214 TaxID=2903777 RepID=UPI00225B6D71|nr:MFS transporter [Streptomyces sp. NBC_01214]MCX4804362.1 MFS transporter [Streptomyces sp. NBC_01214]
MSTPSRIDLLHDRDFGRLFAATALGQLGDRIIFLALPLVAIAALHTDALQVGALTAVTTAGSLLVGRGNLVEGNSKLSAMRSAASISGPALAGPLVGLAGPPATLLMSSAGMAMSGLLALTIRKREQKPEPSESPQLGREIKEGLKFLVKHPVLRATVLGDAIFNLFLVMYQTMLLVFLEREIGLRPSGIGLVLSGMGCGALLGALLATRASKRVGHGPVIWLAPLATCPLTVLMPVARTGWSVYVAALGLAALSLGGVVRVVAQSSVQQALTPDRLLARTGATARFVACGGIPLGGLLGGASGSVFGATATLWIGAAGMTLSVLPNFLSPLRTLRTLPTGKAPEFAR